MTKFTNNNNIFRLCVDILLKVSYNVKRILSQSRSVLISIPRIVLFVLLFLVAMLMSAFPADSCELYSATEAETVLEISLRPHGRDRDCIELSLFSEGAEFCGLLLILRYESDAVELDDISADSELTADMHFSYVDRDGEIRILLDGTKNAEGGELARLSFRRKDGQATEKGLLFEVRVPDGGAYRIEGDRLAPIMTSGCLVTYRWEGGMAEELDAFSAGLRPIDDRLCALEVSFISEGIFSGFEAVVTEIYYGNTQRYLLAGSSRNGDMVCFDREIVVERDKKYTVAVRSVKWNRGGAIYGEERIYILQGGTLTCLG